MQAKQRVYSKIARQCEYLKQHDPSCFDRRVCIDQGQCDTILNFLNVKNTSSVVTEEFVGFLFIEL